MGDIQPNDEKHAKWCTDDEMGVCSTAYQILDMSDYAEPVEDLPTPEAISARELFKSLDAKKTERVNLSASVDPEGGNLEVTLEFIRGHLAGESFENGTLATLDTNLAGLKTLRDRLSKFITLAESA